jgi:hypothetical protein
MSKTEIVFKGGAAITLNLEGLTVNKNAFGEIVSLEWVAGKDRIGYINISEIAAVVFR